MRGTSLFLGIAILCTQNTSTFLFPYDIFWPMEPVPLYQSMENYTGEYVLIGHNVNHFQNLYFISQPPWQSLSMSSHFGFDTARKLHATSEIPNKRTKPSNNMKKHDAIMSVLSSKENTSKDIKTNNVELEIQQKRLQQGVYYIEGKKEKINMNVVKYVKQHRSKIKSTHPGRVEIELRQFLSENDSSYDIDLLFTSLLKQSK